jgi:prenyltransferase beta subunit
MLQVARLSPRLLGDSAGLVLDFLRGQMNDDGGFKDRSGASDLYYTVFGIEGLLALRGELPAERIASYLRGFGGGESLDFIHASCLARCWAALPGDLKRDAPREQILRRVDQFRSDDGAYSATEGAKQGTLYGCFMATGTYQDAGGELTDPAAIVRCIERLRADDGGYANGDDLPMGLTPPSAAAATLLRNLGHAVPAELTDWLLKRHHPEGGFFATPLAPIPDLLSTATALHALSGMHADLAAVREPCLDFVDSLWTNRGAFYGNWTEDVTDCEYTYYGLLALGHLSV